MKYPLIAIALVTLISCNRAADSNLVLQITDNKEIIGQWGIYSTSAGGSVTMCNICPKILFTEAAAFVTIPSGAIETFSWTLKNNVLTVSYINPTIDRTFPDSIYNTLFLKRNKQSELEIRKIESDQSYFLSKQH